MGNHKNCGKKVTRKCQQYCALHKNIVPEKSFVVCLFFFCCFFVVVFFVVVFFLFFLANKSTSTDIYYVSL